MYNNEDFVQRLGEREPCACALRDTLRNENNRDFSCSKGGCGRAESEKTWGLKRYPLASVYSPLQEWSDIYDLETALKRGTVFKELDLPFHGDGNGCGCEHAEGNCGGRRYGR